MSLFFLLKGVYIYETDNQRRRKERLSKEGI